MKNISGFFLFICVILVTLSTGCQKLVGELVDSEPEDAKTITITMVAKSSTNPVFQSALSGAEAAAKDLSEKYSKIDVRIDWRTPKEEDPTAQVERILNAVEEGTDAILVSCSDAEVLTPVINAAVDSGIPVMTFDSDAPNSKRFAFYGPNDVEIGENVMKELASQLGEKGQVAVLAGNQSAPNLQKRVEGLHNAAANYPGIEIVGVFHHVETADSATAEVIRVMRDYPQLQGWAMVGGWPLFSEALLDKIDPEQTIIVAVDALPVQLPYVEKGIAPVLLAQPTFRWGKISVEKIIDKIYLEKDVPEKTQMKLIRVSKENLGGWARQLRAWDYEGIPRKYLTYVAD
jgi:ribose transport system substrate-binding protein